MVWDLKNKTVVITGGAQGIGYDIAEKYLQQEVNIVIIADMNEIKGVDAAKTLNANYGENKAVFIKCDVSKDLEAVSETIFNTYKTVDVLVNNSGIIDESSMRKTLEINTIAVIEWTMKFRDHMRTDKGGKGGTVVNIASMYGYYIDPYMAYYKASKYAVMGFTNTLGHEQNYAKTGVRILAICPGFTYTGLTAKQMVWDEQKEDFEAYRATVSWQPVDAVGKAAVEIFKIGDSGTAWKIIGGGPVERV